MRSLFLVIPLHMVLMVYSTDPNPTPFSIDCKSEDSAEVTVQNGHALESDGCTVTTRRGSTKVYVLDNTCFPDKTFRLTKESKPRFDKDSISFKVACKGDNGVTVKPTAKLGFSQSPSSETRTLFPIPNPNVQLLLLTTKPNPGDSPTTGVAFASLGQAIYLTLVDSSTVDKFLVPLTCHASISLQGGANDEALLWQLHKTDSKTEPCFTESKVDIKKPFETIGKFSVLTMTAFKFSAHENAQITFDCTVRACTTDASDKGTCSQDKAILDKCQSPHRQRREVDDAATSHGDIHHVTATLRIVSHVTEYGTGGSTIVEYTLYCLLLPLLAKVIV